MSQRPSLLIALLALTVLTAALPARAQDGADEGTIITNVWASAEDCAPEAAKKVNFATFAREPGKYAGRCVRLEGLWLGGRALFEDVDAYYAVGPKLADIPKEKRGLRIGLYGKDSVLAAGEGFSAAKVTVTGVAGTCRGLSDGFTITVMGYCHYAGGPILKLSSLTAEPRPYTRFTGRKKRAVFGNLVFAADGWPHRAVVEERLDRWRTAIQKRERQDFAVLNDINLRDMDRRDAQIIRAAMNDSASPFADFHRNLDTLPVAIFVEKAPWQDDESDPRDYTAIACYCRANDCEGRWPISDFDALSGQGRPYICARIWQYFDGGQAREGLETLVGPEGFEEKTKD